jgi:oligogalacturonide transport system permease protein
MGLLRRRQEELMAVTQLDSALIADAEAERANRRTRMLERIGAGIRYAILIAVGLVMIYPLLWLVGASFKSNTEIFTNPSFIPMEPTLDGFIRGWETSTPYTFGHFYWNTFLMVFPKVVGTAISCTLVAYGFARFEFPGKKLLFGCLIAVLLLPDVVTRIPQYLVFRDLGWLDTYLPRMRSSSSCWCSSCAPSRATWKRRRESTAPIRSRC